MVSTLRRGYVVVALAFVLLAGMFGWTLKVGAAAPLYHSAAIHASRQVVGNRPHLECPPPPYDCMGG